MELWSLEGLSVAELLYRTARESWEDSVFGQGGRMAFYQFLALFPSLLILLAITSRVPHFGDYVGDTIRDLGGPVLPAQISQLLRGILTDLNRHALFGSRFIFHCAGAAWALWNSTWAMIYGLNRAYEVQVRRSRWQMTRTYGYLNGVAILLLWLYVSNGAILIGGEMNSEIEKAARQNRGCS